MLILTRRIGKTITLGDNAKVKVTVLSINGKQVKLGIDAPSDLSIYRDEIYQKIQKESL